MTVIEARVHRSYGRNAKLGFIVTALVVGLLSATVAADRWHPILALLFGALLGAVAGGIVWALIRIWPVIRLLWWWTPEILAAVVVVYGFTALATHTTLPVRLGVVALVVGLPAALPWTRRRIIALAWCVIVRHRLRVCFAQFIIANQSGSLPLILWAVPTPVGERVWIYLRTGLSLAELESRLDKIAVTCWASTVVAERASDRNAAYLRLDIKRRDALVNNVESPLVGLVDPDTPSIPRPADEPPTALNLSDVPEPASTVTPLPTPAQRANGKTGTPATAGTSGDDVSDWI